MHRRMVNKWTIVLTCFAVGAAIADPGRERNSGRPAPPGAAQLAAAGHATPNLGDDLGSAFHEQPMCN